MSRYTYNKQLVSEAIDKLDDSCAALSQTNSDIQHGIDVITSARGAENIRVEFDIITGFQPQAIEYITTIKNEINYKAKEIEEYESAPWYKKVFSTAAMSVLKIVEGFIEVNENVIDGHVAIVGFIGGLFNSEFSDSMGEFIETRWVRETTSKWYEEGWLQNVNKYSAYSHDSTAANIFNGVGCVAGYVALSMIPYAGPVISTVAATMGAIGTGTESGLNQGKSYNQAFQSGMIQGGIALATSLITKGAVSKLASSGGALVNSVDDLGRAVSGTKASLTGLKAALGNSGDDILGMVDDMANTIDDIANYADDIMIQGSSKAGSAAKVFENAQQLTKKADALKIAAQSAGYSDDVLNYIDDFANVAKNTESMAKATKNLISNTSSIINGNTSETGTNIMTKAKDIVNKVPVVKSLKSTVNELAKTTAGKAIVQLATTTAKTIPNINSAIATTTGVLSSGTIQDGFASSEYDKIMFQNEEIAKQTSLATENDAAVRNALYEDKYVPSESIVVEDYNNLSYSEPKSSNVVSSYSEKPKQVAINPIELPNRNENSFNNNTIQNIQQSSTINNYESIEDIVNSVVDKNDPSTIASSPKNNLINITELNESLQALNGEEILNSFGDTNTLYEMTSGNKTHVPTSSQPILLSKTKSSSSIIPLGVGLSASAVAGIGTKAYLDKKSKSSEEDEENKTKEEYKEDETSVEIAHETESSQEGNYLSPTDEYAFQE